MPAIGASVVTTVVDRARAFADSLDPDARSALLHDYSTRLARAWSNLPEAVLGDGGRTGLRTATLTPEQWHALEALLRAATGRGYDAIAAHLDADDELRRRGGRHGYGRGCFTVAFLGAPSTSARWELQFGGHHLALAHTYDGGALVGATPAFRGIEPFAPGEPGPMGAKHAALVRALASLDRDRLRAARLAHGRRDLLLGPGRDWAFPDPRAGVRGADFEDRQRELLGAAIDGYVDDLDDGSAAALRAEYERELEDTRLSFAGSRALDCIGDYVRIDGPSVWIELSMRAGIVTPDPHPHSVWRDRRRDYGGPARPAQRNA